ncbi:MAG: DUF4384 domain-containing protein [Deltaproteobacteria bacterium]|nr:DUF4384 domain-containing protein [Deltaproteobacteria bacterium]
MRTLAPLALVAACHTVAVPVVPILQVPPAGVVVVAVEAAPPPLDLTLEVRAERDGARRHVLGGDTLRTGDKLEMFVEVTTPAYVYAVQFYPDGTSAVLYPGSGDHLVRPGRPVRIPEDDFDLILDATRGTENVYVIATREPVRRADATIATQLDEIRRNQDAPVPPASPAPAAATAPATDPATSAPVPASPAVRVASVVGAPAGPGPGKMLTMQSRKVVRVKRADGAPATMATAEQRDDALVILRFAFHHE